LSDDELGWAASMILRLGIPRGGGSEILSSQEDRPNDDDSWSAVILSYVVRIDGTQS
jgi:hypothetical protein